MLNLIAVFLVCSGIGIAVHIAIDLTHRPQSMKIMNTVWILSVSYTHLDVYKRQATLRNVSYSPTLSYR